MSSVRVLDRPDRLERRGETGSVPGDDRSAEFEHDRRDGLVDIGNGLECLPDLRGAIRYVLQIGRKAV